MLGIWKKNYHFHSVHKNNCTILNAENSLSYPDDKMMCSNCRTCILWNNTHRNRNKTTEAPHSHTHTSDATKHSTYLLKNNPKTETRAQLSLCLVKCTHNTLVQAQFKCSFSSAKMSWLKINTVFRVCQHLSCVCTVIMLFIFFQGQFWDLTNEGKLWSTRTSMWVVHQLFTSSH